MIIDACTLFDKEHANEGAVCCRSILSLGYCGKVYALCLDKRSEYISSSINGVHVVPLNKIEESYPELLEAKTNRPWNAYAVTLKPFFVSYLIEVIGSRAVVMVDSDVFFFSAPVSIAEELEQCSILVTTRGQNPPPSQGNINGGFFACKNDSRSSEFLVWWRRRVSEWCLWELGNGGLYSEEGYLKIIDESPWAFPGCKVSCNPGLNLAWWNVKNHEVCKSGSGYKIDNIHDLVCFHYQGGYIPRADSDTIKGIYSDYFKLLESCNNA